MSRRLSLCDVCGQLGPYGLPAILGDGASGYLWACESHRDAVRDRARASRAAPASTSQSGLPEPGAAAGPCPGAGAAPVGSTADPDTGDPFRPAQGQ